MKKKVPFIARVEFNAWGLGNIRAWTMTLIQTEINFTILLQKSENDILCTCFRITEETKEVCFALG